MKKKPYVLDVLTLNNFFNSILPFGSSSPVHTYKVYRGPGRSLALLVTSLGGLGNFFVADVRQMFNAQTRG